MFLVPLVVFLGVKFGFRKSSLCKRNDKYEVCLGDQYHGELGELTEFDGSVELHNV